MPPIAVDWSTSSGRTMPLPIVSATAVPVSAPSSSMVLPMMTACRGRSTRVETTAAIAFAASLTPLE